MDFQTSVLGRMNGFLYRCRADENYTMLEMTDGTGSPWLSSFPATFQRMHPPPRRVVDLNPDAAVDVSGFTLFA